MALIPFVLFFLSGAASLVYEVAWARSLGVIFGASHLAVTTVLAVYMGGQALGSALLGARADRTARPLRLYGQLELGIGLSAVAFVGLMAVYPVLYVPLARVAEESPLYLTAVRTIFAVAATIVPTTLMGGTLPTLSRFFARREGGLARQLSFLYAFNTFGAVAGTLLAGFVLLPALGVTGSVLVAAAVSAGVGGVSILLQRREEVVGGPAECLVADGSPAVPAEPGEAGGRPIALGVRLTLFGVGLSGFCALGYEVLWTRMLTLVVGTSVYSFTVMLVAFLGGIALGSHACGLLLRRGRAADPRGGVVLFGVVQVLIGASALAVTVLMQGLPHAAGRVHAMASGLALSSFGGRLASSFGLALAYVLAPAFLMGLAFPLAGAVWSSSGGRAGAAVGRLLTSNTLGAILGSVTTGFVLVYLFGIERSLQMLIILNVAGGAAIAVSAWGGRRAAAAVAVAGAAVLVARGVSESRARAWDQQYFATYANTHDAPEAPEETRSRLRDTEVLYYHEGVDETVSVIRSRGDPLQTFIVNGRPEASNAPMDMQVQRTLGHLPVLLNQHPRSVFVLGTGSGMTLGATSLHPEVERIVLAEIEPGVLGVARTFSRYNAGVLDDPRLHVVFNDGRNYLASTRQKFDVITADPIHPWSGGAAYLYTTEYFRTVAQHLAPGGVASQWLPLYELSTEDIRTVLRTFAGAFPHVMVWLTYYDAALIGSNDPIVIDERALARRMSRPAIRDDLAAVHMETAQDLLSYFVMGDAGARAFALGGLVNTDDDLVLEFSAPRSQDADTVNGNVLALAADRESLLPYLAPAPAEGERRADAARWTRDVEVARLFDRAHALYLGGARGAELEGLLARVRTLAPDYAPLRFLLDEEALAERCEPALVARAAFEVSGLPAGSGPLEISAVRQFMGRGRVLVSFVDNARREIYAQNLIYGRYEQLEAVTRRYVADTLQAVRASVASAAPAGALRATLGREAKALAPQPGG